MQTIKTKQKQMSNACACVRVSVDFCWYCDTSLLPSFFSRLFWVFGMKYYNGKSTSIRIDQSDMKKDACSPMCAYTTANGLISSPCTVHASNGQPRSTVEILQRHLWLWSSERPFVCLLIRFHFLDFSSKILSPFQKKKKKEKRTTTLAICMHISE